MAKQKKYQDNQIFIIKKIKKQKKWTNEEDGLLVQTAQEFNEKKWKEISKRFLNKNSLQCFSRYKRIRPGIQKGPWKKREDMNILELVKKYGKAWSKISFEIGTRNGKQIRDRFTNVLDPEIKKGRFTEEEDRLLIKLFKQLGSKWSSIATYFPKRTADMIKNRFHSSIKKRMPSLCQNLIDNTQKDHFKSDLSTIDDSKSRSREALKMVTDQCMTFNAANENNENSLSNCLRNDYSTVTSKECESFFSQFSDNNNEIPFYEREIKMEDSVEESNSNWNFDEFFSL